MDSLDHYVQMLAQSLEKVNYLQFALNLIATALLASFLAWFYVRFGNTINNRERFARNFLPLALTTMLIIFIVKSSVTLSLGLVGALSIVRFRSAIKDPEELVYLFLAIGLGLAAGANEILIGAVAFVFILGLLFLQKVLRKQGRFRPADHLHLHLSTTQKDLNAVSAVLEQHFSFVELKRLDERDDRLDLSFNIAARNLAEIDSARQALNQLPGSTNLSIVEPRSLPV